MNEYRCENCYHFFKSEDAPAECPSCGHDDIRQTCPMCGSVIDDDTKVCPECKEPVA